MRDLTPVERVACWAMRWLPYEVAQAELKRMRRRDRNRRSNRTEP